MSATTKIRYPLIKSICEHRMCELIIRDYIKNLDGCDALWFSVTNSEINFTPYVCGDSGDYEQGSFSSGSFDVEDMYEDREVKDSTLLRALWTFARKSFSNGIFAVDPDSGNTILYR